MRYILLALSFTCLFGACNQEAKTASPSTVDTKTVETRMVTDHFGNTVEIPTHPARIATLHGPSATVLLTELGLADRIIGTATRIKSETGQPYIRGVEEIFGTTLEESGYYNYGPKGKDIEQIKLSKPDLIIGWEQNANSKYDILNSIAPTVILSTYSQDVAKDIFKMYRDLASWVGSEKVFDEKYKKYQKKIKNIQSRLPQGFLERTIAYLAPHISKGKIGANLHNKAFTRVLYDIGLKPHPFLFEVLGDSGWNPDLSPEVIGGFYNADYILSTYRNQTGETVQTVLEGFDKVSEGWRDILHAYKNDNMLILNRELAATATFAGCHYVLDEFEKYIK